MIFWSAAVGLAIIGLSVGSSEWGGSADIKASFRCVCPNRYGFSGHEEGLKFYFKRTGSATGFGEMLGMECRHICRQGERRRRRKKRQVGYFAPLVGFNSCVCSADYYAGGCSYNCAPPAPIVMDAPSPLWAYAPQQRLSSLYTRPLFWRR